VGAARIPAYYTLFEQMRSIGDVILISQRGTGLSTPRLVCRGAGAIPADVLASADRMGEVLGARAVACASEWRAKGVDLSAFNTEASADDLEDLRVALGVPKISLFGFSYGTHLALAAIRRHPSSIARVVLAGTEGPDHAQKLPLTFDLQLARIAALEAALPNAPTPGLVEVTRSLLATLQAAPIHVDAKVPGLDAPVRLTIGKEGLQYLMRRDIGDTNDTAGIVRMIRETSRGEYRLLSRLAGRRFAEFSGGTALMGLAMDCASGSSVERMAHINREIPTGLLGRMTNFPFPDVCGLLKLPPLPETFRAPIVSLVPALFVSGSLDSNTPPYQAEEVRWGFPNSVHLVVENAGHESTLVPDVQRAMADFLKGMDVRDRRASAPVPLK
jgi:pimeloyl-ACP methyl ester carboxylesterase